MYHEPYKTGPKHHLFYPATWYKTELEKEFRNCACVVVLLDPNVHGLLHACMDGAPPKKPTIAYMAGVVERYHSGTCECTHHPKKVVNLDEQRRKRRGAST